MSAAFSVERDQTYGDFKPVQRLFSCECVYCGSVETFNTEELAASPTCKCADTTEKSTSSGVVIDFPAKATLEKGISKLSELKEKLVSGQQDLAEDDPDNYSLFLKEVDEINELLSHTSGEAGVRKFQNATLKMLIDLIPYAEREYRTYPKQSNAYSLNALVSQVRELTQDLNAAQDQAALVETVMGGVLQPAFLQIGQILIDSMHSLRKGVESDIIEEKKQRVTKVIDQTTRDMAKSFQDLFYDVKKRVADQLL